VCGHRPGDLGVPGECAPDCNEASWVLDDGPFPFRLGIHAGREFADGWKRETLAPGAFVLWHPKHGRKYWVPQNRLGALLGFVTVTGCHHADECAVYSMDGAGDLDYVPLSHCSPWAEPGCFHWTLADPEPLDVPVPMKGRLGLWRLVAKDAADVQRVIGQARDRIAREAGLT
jgi:hypothetical protein